MRHWLISALALAACTNKASDDDPKEWVDADTDADADADTDADSDADSDADTDSDTDVDTPNEATAFCAAGGPVSDGAVSGVICLSPLDVASTPATDGTHTWKPGPTGRVYK